MCEKSIFIKSFLVSNMSNVQNDVHDIEHSSLIVPYTTEKTTIEIIDSWGCYRYYCIRS